MGEKPGEQVNQPHPHPNPLTQSLNLPLGRLQVVTCYITVYMKVWIDDKICRFEEVSRVERTKNARSHVYN